MAYITKATAQLMRDLGSTQSPQNAFLLNLGSKPSTCGCRATAGMRSGWPNGSKPIRR